MQRFAFLLLCLIASCQRTESHLATLDQQRFAHTAEQKLLQAQPYEVQLNKNGIKLDGEFRILRGGSFQWFRMPEATWNDRMKKYRALGFNTLDIYIAWNQVEAEEGVFNFERPGLRRFLELARQNGIFVAIRPGPFITNEMDGGGLPAWLTKRSTKQSFAADGKPNLRTHDPDFIDSVRRYWEALNREIAPFTADRGGPIVLYVIENEYTWFEKYLGYEPLFRLDGSMERPFGQAETTRPYFTPLHKIVRDSGVRIPIVTCPGDGKASAMGDVPDVAPFPNVYEWANAGQPEEIVFDLLTDMHDPKLHGGIYQDMPTGSMEVNRSTQEIRRLLMGGSDATFAFNIVGMSQPGRMNALTLAARAGDQDPHWGAPDEAVPDWLGSIFDFGSWDNLANGFAAPKLGYFSGVVDYNGAISSSGVLRDLFFQFRRDNLYWESVESWLAPSEKPQRSGRFTGANPDLSIDQKNIGVRQDLGMVHYWHQGANGTAFVSLLNQSGQPQIIPQHAIRFRDQSLPQYAPILVPLAQDARSFYAQIMNFDLPMGSAFQLRYATSEILSLRTFNKDQLLVVYGPAESLGEIKVSGKNLRVVSADPGFQLRESTAESVVFTYPHVLGNMLILEDVDGQRLRLVTSDTTRAGHFWFLQQKGQDLVIAGPDFVDAKDASYVLDFDDRPGEVWVMSARAPDAMPLPLLEAYDPIRGTSRYTRPESALWPEPPALQNLRSKEDGISTATDGWQSWTGNPKSLDDLGIYQGHAWYKAKFTIENLAKLKDDQLYVDSASDIVGIFINGRYVTTVAPVGTEIDNQSRSVDYRFGSIKPYLQQGVNEISFRTEIWGHGSFMFGQGRLPLIQARLPALGYDGRKGLMGTARIAGIPLLDWQVRAGLPGEQAGFAGVDYDDSNWEPARPGLVLKKGGILWLRAELESADFPDAQAFDAPLVLQLKGLSSKATIYFNGQLLGRWLSDAAWLQQGSWVRPQVGMWINLDPNDLPIPRELLNPHGRNHIAIAFEDSSSAENPSGVISTLALRYNREGSQWNGTAWKTVPGQRQRVTVKLL